MSILTYPPKQQSKVVKHITFAGLVRHSEDDATLVPVLNVLDAAGNHTYAIFGTKYAPAEQKLREMIQAKTESGLTGSASALTNGLQHIAAARRVTDPAELAKYPTEVYVAKAYPTHTYQQCQTDSHGRNPRWYAVTHQQVQLSFTDENQPHRRFLPDANTAAIAANVSPK